MKNIVTGQDIPIYEEHAQRTIRLLRKLSDPEPALAALLGARIAYELSIWHEIASFFTWEQYSSFSPEDNYSNILGCYIGFKALLSKYEFNTAAEVELYYILRQLHDNHHEITELSLDYVKNYWYRINPNLDVEEMPSHFSGYSPRSYCKLLRESVQLELLKRNFDANNEQIVPWLISNVDVPGSEMIRDQIRSYTGYPAIPLPILVPKYDLNEQLLSDYYRLEILVDTDVIPIGFLFGLTNPITSQDFPTLIESLRIIFRNKYGWDADTPW